MWSLSKNKAGTWCAVHADGTHDAFTSEEEAKAFVDFNNQFNENGTELLLLEVFDQVIDEPIT